LITDGPAFAQTMTLRGTSLYPPTCSRGGSACPDVKAAAAAMEQIGVLGQYAPAGSKDSVVLFQMRTMGNACNGGPLFFIRFVADGSYVYSKVIDHCGGPDPTIKHEGNVVRITVPEHPPNRGTGTIAETASEYDLATGAVKKLR
jgi:hypothetical protein